MILLKLLFLSLLVLPISCTQGKNSDPSLDVSVESLYEGNNVLWGFDFESSERILLTKRSGEIHLLDLKTKESQELSGGPKARVQRQGGLLDVLFHQIDGIRYVYFTYSDSQGEGSTVSLARAEWDEQVRSLKSLENIFTAQAEAPPGRHYGSRLIFDEEGYLFMTIGDRGVRDQAQNPSNHSGSLLRLNSDGSTPSDNPFVNDPEIKDEIWTYGHRNQQGIDIHPETKDVWTVEFGPKGGDEVNLIKKGENYGWPKMTHGREYSGAYIAPDHVEGMEPPITHFTPAISPSGMTFYNGEVFSEWRGNLFLAALGERHIHRLVIDFESSEVVDQEKLFEGLGERIRHIRQGPDGLIYFSTDSGKLMRIVPNS